MSPVKIPPLRDLNGISTVAKQHCGIAPERIYKEKEQEEKEPAAFLSDCLQKIAFSIQDLNNELEIIENESYGRKDIVYIILLVTWIEEGFSCIRDKLKPCLLVESPNKKELEKARKFIKAARSFIVAHPLTTDKHPDFGFDGNYICVDISSIHTAIHSLLGQTPHYCHLSFNGLDEMQREATGDFVLRIYSQKKDGMQYSQHICCSFADFYKVAALYIDRLYQLDAYIRKAARNHII